MSNDMVTYEMFRCLSDPIRCSIVEFLSRQEMSVNELTSHFEVSRPAISRHLRVLREGGLVSESRSGRERIYRLETDRLKPGRTWIRRVETGEVGPPPLGGPSADATSFAEPREAPKPESPPTRAEWRQW